MNARKVVEGTAPVEVTPEQRYRLINDAASFRALLRQRQPRKGCKDVAAACWCEVEAEIDGVLRKSK